STQPSEARKHTVQKGETFSTIAAAAYGSANYYPHIMRANPNVQANRLKPGMVLILPPASEVIPSEKPSDVRTEAVTAAHKTAAPSIDPTKEYKVVSGDSLHKIATNLYGKVAMVDKIYELNKSTIGPNPAALKVGTVLKLPEPPVNTTAANAR
ncbi:MAG TPA: LysM domain-containing protein, partial [Acidobacteriaceae bacterium]|nr:LysM domain-containing protein [Acidobacteriaceae bacterium]